MPDEKKESATAFLKAAIAYYASLGVTVAPYDRQWLLLQVVRLPRCLPRVRPAPHPHQAYTPKTNGKAERFIQTALREWAYAKAYTHSDGRTAELPIWLHRYNCTAHGSLKAKTPISRLASPRTTC